jgi:hypothetical protein
VEVEGSDRWLCKYLEGNEDGNCCKGFGWRCIVVGIHRFLSKVGMVCDTSEDCLMDWSIGVCGVRRMVVWNIGVLLPGGLWWCKSGCKQVAVGKLMALGERMGEGVDLV